MTDTPVNIDYKAALEKVLAINEAQQFAIQNLQLQILQLKKLIYGSRHEKFTGSSDANAPTLFDLPPLAEVVTTATTTVTYEKKKTELKPNHKGRNPLPDSLRREIEVLYPEGIDVSGMEKIGEDVSERLALQLPELFVKRTERPKFMDPVTGRIYQAGAPERCFEKCSLDPSVVAQIAVEKFVDHIPLHRQQKRYSRMGVNLSDSTIGDGVAMGATVLTALQEAHKKMILESHYLHVDETTIKVLESERKGASHLGYYWVYQAHEQKLVLFDYQMGRGREGPEHILKDYQGYLQTDGYGVYDDFADRPGITLLFCMAHARRKFNEALVSDKVVAAHAMAEIQKLYAIERHLTDNNITGDAKQQYRQEYAVPLLKALGTWMKERHMEVLPKSAIGKALGYSIKRWDKLSLYATTAHLNIDNNPVENSIRPVAVGRKNYLFAGSHAAAQRAAIYYSLFATCKNYNINPYTWLLDVFNRIASHKINKIEELLPQNWKPLEVD